MGMFDSLMAGAQPNPQLGAALQGMPETDPRRLALLRGLGMQPGDAGAQVTGNWMDSGAPPGAPPMPQRPMSPTPATSPASSAVQPTGPAPRNPPGPSGQGAPPLPTVAGNAGPMLPGIGTPPPMGQAPSGAPVPASSPLATAGPQGVPSVGGNAGPMTPPLSGFGGLTPPGDIPAGLQQMLTNPQTGRPFTQQQYVNHTVGVSPITAYDAMQMPGGMEMYGQYQRMAEGAANNLTAMQQALTNAQGQATNRAVGMSEQGRLAGQAFGANGMPGQMQLAAQDQQNRNATVNDALNHEAQRQRWLSGVVQQHIQATGTPPTTDEMAQYEATSRQVFPAAGQPSAAVMPGGQAPPGTQPPAAAPPATAPAGNRAMLDRIWSQVLRQHGTLPAAAGGSGHGPSSLRIDPADAGRSNQAITSFVSRALETPGVTIGELHSYLGERFDPASVTRWMQQQRGGTAGVDAHTEQALGGYLGRLRDAGVDVGDRQYSLGMPGTVPLNPARMVQAAGQYLGGDALLPERSLWDRLTGLFGR